jgi:hypothetical protein
LPRPEKFQRRRVAGANGPGKNPQREGARKNGGTILGVGIDVGEENYLDMEKEAIAALARD